MKLIFHPEFYKVYSDESAAVAGRMEAIIDYVQNNSDYEIVQPVKADYFDLSAVHEEPYLKQIYSEKYKQYQMAVLAAGGAIMASEIAINGEPAFAAIRPPGHHAYKNQAWGYCYLCNMAIALTKLIKNAKISSAFILDFDAHTGDGTIDCLKQNKNIKIFNPMAEADKYIKVIEDYIKELDYVDIVCVCAGFDSYEKDCGGKLKTFDYYTIGRMMKLLAKRFGHNRRFAILEGGYYQPDLGKNVLSFMQGFDD